MWAFILSNEVTYKTGDDFNIRKLDWKFRFFYSQTGCFYSTSWKQECTQSNPYQCRHLEFPQSFATFCPIPICRGLHNYFSPVPVLRLMGSPSEALYMSTFIHCPADKATMQDDSQQWSYCWSPLKRQNCGCFCMLHNTHIKCHSRLSSAEHNAASQYLPLQVHLRWNSMVFTAHYK